MIRTDTPANSDDRLQRLLGGAQLDSLRQRMRRHFERIDNGTAGSSLLLTQLSLAEHEALGLLIGRPSRISRSVRVDIERLDSALRDAGIADSLRAALERIDGPIVSRAAVRANTHAQWIRMMWLLGLAAGSDALLEFSYFSRAYEPAPANLELGPRHLRRTTTH